MKTHHKLTAVATLMALILIGCGGGGSSGSSAPAISSAPPVFNYKSASQVLHNSGQSVSFNATQTGSANCNGSGVITVSPATTATTFYVTPSQSINAWMATSTVTLNWTNCTPATTKISEIDYFDANSLQPRGFSTNSGFGVFLNPPTYPSTVAADETGTIGTMNLYMNSTESTLLGYSDWSYSVVAGSISNTVLITITAQTYNSSNALIETVSTVGQLTSSGTVTIKSETIQNLQTGNVVTLTAS